MSDLLARISIDPRVCHGKPCVKETRIIVSLIVQFLANGDTIADILRSYTDLTEEDVRACLTYAAEMTRESFDGIITASGAHRLVEVMAGDYTNHLNKNICGGRIAQNEYDAVVQSITREEPVATRCGWNYDLVICDKMLYDAINGYPNGQHPNVNLVYDGGCANAGKAPTGYIGNSHPLTDGGL